MKRLLRDGVMEKMRKRGTNRDREKMRKRGTNRDREKEMKIEKNRGRKEGKERGNT